MNVRAEHTALEGGCVDIPATGSTSDRAMSYARARLWLGISSVGTFVVMAALALAFDLPQMALDKSDASVGTALIAGVQVLVLYVLIGLPFDVLGGYWLPRAFGRSCLPLGRFARQWLRAVSLQSLLMLVSALLILAAGRRWGFPGAGCVVASLMLLVVAYRARVGILLAGLRTETTTRTSTAGSFHPSRVRVLRGADESFSGCISGLPGFEQLVLPAAWVEQLTDEQIAVQILRREGILCTGSGTRGIALALSWNLAGFVICGLAPGAGVATVAGLVTLALWFTLWSFVGLLLLPTPSRAAVHEVDQFALRRGANKQTLRLTMERLDRWQDDEPSRPRGVEAIFYPVPSTASRLRRLEESRPARGAYQAARLALPLSWVCLGLLGRAVHCNCGRPELWVMLPGD